jgi:hypothetical protein
MWLRDIVLTLNPIFNGIGNIIRTSLIYLGLNPESVGSAVNLAGVFLAGLLTVIIVTLGVISFVQGLRTDPFFHPNSEEAFVRSKISTVIGLITLVCSIWFLFALVYLSLNNGL